MRDVVYVDNYLVVFVIAWSKIKPFAACVKLMTSRDADQEEREQSFISLCPRELIT